MDKQEVWVVKMFDVETPAYEVEVYVFKSREEAIAYIQSDYNSIIDENGFKSEDYELTHNEADIDNENYVLNSFTIDYWWSWEIFKQKL